MRRIIIFLLLSICFSVQCSSQTLNDYEDNIYSSIQDISKSGITIYDLDEISVDSVFDYIISIIAETLKAPGKLLCIIIVLSVLQRVADILSGGKAFCKDMFTMISFISVVPQLMSAVEDITAAIESTEYFVASYIPIFASIIGCSGNLKAASSYNAILLYASEGATAALSVFIKPLLYCMLVTSVIHAINSDMPDITFSIRRLIVTLMGFIMSVFLGIIGLQGIVGRTADSITVKAGKYLISSFVPIIGSSLNESYRTVKLSLDSIRSLVGSFGIVIILMILCIPIIKGFIFRWIFTLSEFLSGSIGCSGIASLCKSLSEVFLLITAVITLYMLMLVIATGAMIAIGGSII